MTRRDALERLGTGFGMVGLANMLGEHFQSEAATVGGPSTTPTLEPKAPHFPAKAKQDRKSVV